MSFKFSDYIFDVINKINHLKTLFISQQQGNYLILSAGNIEVFHLFFYLEKVKNLKFKPSFLEWILACL